MFTNRLFELNSINSGAVQVCSPSNIALVKYWGKHGNQLPCNPSLSITLKNAVTNTSINFEKSLNPKNTFLFDDKENIPFKTKIDTFLTSIIEYFPFLKDYSLHIKSSNTFPHSSGIASSASSMSALALCLIEIEKKLSLSQFDNFYYQCKASFIARLGSGSASRSLFQGMSIWGEVSGIENSSDEFAIGFNKFHQKFAGICDAIAIISKSEKSVSSRIGHSLMNNHPFREVRFDNARKNLGDLLETLNQGDFLAFSEIVESEALELHGLMMNSRPSFILMEPNTLEAINRIRNFRKKSGLDICFTLDAGANVHVLYLESAKNHAEIFIKNEIAPLCEDELVIFDQMGDGSYCVHT